MELGTLQIQIFVSLVVVLGTAFVAFLCDFLKGNNEQLRERNIEMRVRQEEQQRFGVWEPAKLLKGIEALLKNTPALQQGAPPVVAPAEAPLEPAQSPSWEQPAEPAAAKTGTWASKEELEKLAERAARIRERHEARKAAEETSEPEPPAAPTVLPVALASIAQMPEAVAVPEGDTAPERVEEEQERIEEALGAGETPPLMAETESAEQEPQAASAQTEAGGVLEWAAAEEAPSGDLEQAGAAMEIAETVPEATAETEPLALEPGPATREAEAEAIEAEGSGEWAGEPVAGLQMALPHAVPEVIEPGLAELARSGEEAILEAQQSVRLPEGELPLAPIEVIEDTAAAAVEEAVEEAAEEPLAVEQAEGEAAGEPEFLRVRVLPIDQPAKEGEEVASAPDEVAGGLEEVAGGPEELAPEPVEVDGKKLIAAAELEAPVLDAPVLDAPVLNAMQPAVPEPAVEPEEVEAIEPAAEITSLHESLAKEEPGLPAGLHDVTLLRERMKANLNFEGVAVSIGINDYEALRQKLDTSAGAESMASVERLIQSMLKGSDFACRFQDDEFILLFPGEADSSAQRRLFQISEKLWDFQLRSLGHHSIMFSWGGLEVKRDTLADAVASARERMFQTKRNRTGAIEMRKRVVNG